MAGHGTPGGGNATVGAPPAVELRSVGKWFGDLHVLKSIDLTITTGEAVVIIGPSGSGKSTLCRVINRLEPIQEGEVLLDGELLPLERY